MVIRGGRDWVKRLKRLRSKSLKNQRHLSRWACLLEATKHLANDITGCKIKASQSETWLRVAR